MVALWDRFKKPRKAGSRSAGKDKEAEKPQAIADDKGGKKPEKKKGNKKSPEGRSPSGRGDKGKEKGEKGEKGEKKKKFFGRELSVGQKEAKKEEDKKGKKEGRNEKDPKKSAKKKKKVKVNKEKAELFNKVLIQPKISESSMNQQVLGKYIFIVDGNAGKRQIAEAVKAMYGVHVLKVNIMNYKTRSHQFRGFSGNKKGFKKAVVSLKQGDTIDLFKEVK